jgi:hypothetical protein
MIKSNNTIQIIEQNIYKERGAYICLAGCNRIANNILNDLEANGFKIVKIAMDENKIV